MKKKSDFRQILGVCLPTDQKSAYLLVLVNFLVWYLWLGWKPTVLAIAALASFFVGAALGNFIGWSLSKFQVFRLFDLSRRVGKSLSVVFAFSLPGIVYGIGTKYLGIEWSSSINTKPFMVVFVATLAVLAFARPDWFERNPYGRE